MAARNVPTLTPNGLDAERFHNPVTTGATSSSSQNSPADIATFVRSNLPRPASLLRSNSGLHEAFPAGLLTETENQDASFLDFPPEIPSAEEDRIRYCGVVMSLGPEEEENAVVKTRAGPEVICSTKGCQGAGRLREGELVQICHHTSGEDQGKTFITHVAAECTPISSLAVSRAGSRAPSRPPTPAGT